jgi:hypothetical protein
MLKNIILGKFGISFTIHETNGLAERFNRTLVNMARVILFESKLPERLWAEAMNYSVYTKNRLPHSAIRFKTPFEKWFEKLPHVSHLWNFGKEAYIHIPEDSRPPGSKFNARAVKSSLVGYCEKEGWYRFWTGTTVVISGDYS